MKYLKLYEAIWEYSFREWFEKYYSYDDVKYIIDINCSGKKLTSLEGIEKLTNLVLFHCYENYDLKTLKGLENLTQLKYLSCYCCNLTSLEPLKDLINLEKLYCLMNPLKTLKGIENCISIRDLECEENELITLEPLRNLKNLERLLARNNNLEDLKGLEDLRKLNCLWTEGNPFNKLTLADAGEIIANMKILNGQVTDHTDITYTFRNYDFQKRIIEEQPENIKCLKGIGVNSEIKEEYKEILSLFGIK